MVDSPEERLTPHFRELFSGPLMGNGGYTKKTANVALASEELDMVSFGVSFLANPDLPARLKANAALNTPDPDTFYQGEEKGYIDYPTMDDATKPESIS